VHIQRAAKIILKAYERGGTWDFGDRGAELRSRSER